MKIERHECMRSIHTWMVSTQMRKFRPTALQEYRDRKVIRKAKLQVQIKLRHASQEMHISSC